MTSTTQRVRRRNRVRRHQRTLTLALTLTLNKARRNPPPPLVTTAPALHAPAPTHPPLDRPELRPWLERMWVSLTAPEPPVARSGRVAVGRLGAALDVATRALSWTQCCVSRSGCPPWPTVSPVPVVERVRDFAVAVAGVEVEVGVVGVVVCVGRLRAPWGRPSAGGRSRRANGHQQQQQQQQQQRQGAGERVPTTRADGGVEIPWRGWSRQRSCGRWKTPSATRLFRGMNEAAAGCVCVLGSDTQNERIPQRCYLCLSSSCRVCVVHATFALLYSTRVPRARVLATVGVARFMEPHLRICKLQGLGAFTLDPLYCYDWTTSHFKCDTTKSRNQAVTTHHYGLAWGVRHGCAAARVGAVLSGGRKEQPFRLLPPSIAFVPCPRGRRWRCAHHGCRVLAAKT